MRFFSVIFLCGDADIRLRMLHEFDRQGMMTSEYVYILPVMDVDRDRALLTPWLAGAASGDAAVRRQRRYYEHVRLVRD